MRGYNVGAGKEKEGGNLCVSKKTKKKKEEEKENRKGKRGEKRGRHIT